MPENNPEAYGELDQALNRIKELVTTTEGGQLGFGAQIRDFAKWLGETFPDAFNEQGKDPESMNMNEYRQFRQP